MAGGGFVLVKTSQALAKEGECVVNTRLLDALTSLQGIACKLEQDSLTLDYRMRATPLHLMDSLAKSGFQLVSSTCLPDSRLLWTFYRK